MTSRPTRSRWTMLGTVAMTYYISPRFLNKLAVHITKNFLEIPGVRVPLILGVHGRKGEGKTFQCDLVFERMGIEVVQMSAGELESPDAGDPSRLIRLRYREAAELVRVRGKMAVLLINDLDAGAGRFDQGTQYTVNTQLVNGTLMNIADSPTNVQLPGSYDEKPIRRVPIIVTGNDFSTLYAPLIRDGRMEKFYWAPDRSDRIGIVGGIFGSDGLPAEDIEDLVNTFPNQSIDFYSALRARVFDQQVERFIHQIGIEAVSQTVVNGEGGTPNIPLPTFTLSRLKEIGQAMVAEQQRIADMRLAREYNQHLNSGVGVQPGSESSVVGGSDRVGPGSNNKSDRVSKSISERIARRVSGRNGTGRNRSERNRSERLSVADADANTASRRDRSPSASSKSKSFKSKSFYSARGLLDNDVLDTVHGLVDQGYRIGVEHVDTRRFRTNAWQSCKSLDTRDAQAAVAHLEDCLDRH